ncbi:glycosyltransferase family 2 protein [Loktanella sp. S4079]|uniref:glycosyltransferase family 2 protein n=1 Tax=Loktanella sp. S4079 TaxID=579483 RepID=UPI0005FA6F82|nr:glycosyltransferase family 2 protein [Loktanella sp. S4079]
MRWKRRRYLFRIWRKRHEIQSAVDRTNLITTGDILTFSTVRNEMLRLPYFLEYYRKMGVRHFLFVDNDSDDGTTEYLKQQPDVSLWTTGHSYKLSRFGMDWLGWLQWQYGHGHWCLTVDADELLIYPHHDTRNLSELTAYLDSIGRTALGALMLDMYPKGAVSELDYQPGQDPTKLLTWFDPDGYRHKIHPIFSNQWIQGGVRDRVFFGAEPHRAPTLNKTPLVKWNWRNVYVTSTHHMLPRRMNRVFDWPERNLLTGVLLHTKFLQDISDRSQEELNRGQHFENSTLYESYYRRLIDGLDLWDATAVEYTGWQQLERLGLMSQGDWNE